MATLNLLGTTTRVEVPVVGIQIGNHTLGLFSKVSGGFTNGQLFIKSLEVTKINGVVNRYTLKLDYPVTQKDDPNYIDKIIASVSDTRKITFSYGDASVPDFIYKEEKATILRVKKKPSASTCVKSYTIYAISTGVLSTAGSFKFDKRTEKPSTVIKEILFEPKYGLQTVFYGMRDKDFVEMKGLIRDDDEIVEIPARSNISVLEYLQFLVDCMSPSAKTLDDLNLIKKGVYVLLFEDNLGTDYDGPYFRVARSDKLQEKSSAYEINIGYPSENVVTSFDIDDDETYAILYKYSSAVQSDLTKEVIDDNGNIVQVFDPSLGSNSPLFKVTEPEKTWWTKVTQYPIHATITFKGLLRPAILMSYVRINIYYYGRKDIDSGLYIVLSQQDNIDTSGYRTTLKLFRVGGDDAYVD